MTGMHYCARLRRYGRSDSRGPHDRRLWIYIYNSRRVVCICCHLWGIGKSIGVGILWIEGFMRHRCRFIVDGLRRCLGVIGTGSEKTFNQWYVRFR